jgi:hypothetical protein
LNAAVSGLRVSSVRGGTDRIAVAIVTALTKRNLEKTVLDLSGASQKPSIGAAKG